MALCIPWGMSCGGGGGSADGSIPADTGGKTDTGVPDTGGGDHAIIDGGTGSDTGGGDPAIIDGGTGPDDGGHGQLDGGVCVMPPQTSRLRIINGCTQPMWIHFSGTDNSTTFYWSTANATACTLNGNSVPVNSPGAGYPVRLTQTTTYTLECTGPGGPVTQTATVIVNPSLSIVTIGSFQAAPVSADPVTQYSLSIATAYASSCTVDNGVGNVTVNGQQLIPVPSVDTTYTLTCQGLGGPVTAHALVAVENPKTDVKFTSFNAAGLAVTYGGNLINPTNHQKLNSTCDYVDYSVPEAGLAGMRFWPGLGCDGTGNNCAIGQSGGPAIDGFTAPAGGYAPAVDSKFEGTFGCLPSVPSEQCQVNPSNPSLLLPTTDSWDTSNVDGFTVPYRVKVLDTCAGGPPGGVIDCSALSFNYCPTNENASTPTTPPLPVDLPWDPAPPFPQYQSLNLLLPQLANPGLTAGCYSPCSKLTISNQGNNPGGAGTVGPADNRAAYYCCVGPTTGACYPRTQTGCPCGFGPVLSTNYVAAIHQYCPNVYAYAYDDNNGLFGCPAGTHYEVIFNCPQ